MPTVVSVNSWGETEWREHANSMREAWKIADGCSERCQVVKDGDTLWVMPNKEKADIWRKNLRWASKRG